MPAYDGSTETTDLRAVTLGRSSGNQLVATFTVDGPIPAAGSTFTPALYGSADLPDGRYNAFAYKAMFQNRAVQTNVDNPSGGCSTSFGGRVRDQHGHWADGYHFYVGFDVWWDGARWIHSVSAGEYDPSPDGGFLATELGSNNGDPANGGWIDHDPLMAYGEDYAAFVTSTSGSTTVTVRFDGVVSQSNPSCASSAHRAVYAQAGHHLSNVKGLSSANVAYGLPILFPTSLMPGFRDLRTIGGFAAISDTTQGASTDWLGVIFGDQQIESIAYTPGIAGASVLAGTAEVVADNQVEATLGALNLLDTLGDSPACPTPTFGGMLPGNPLHNPAYGCQYDDDNVPMPNGSNPAGPWLAANPGTRGVLLAEFWDTSFGFTY